MPEHNAPLEELLEAAEASVTRPTASPRMLMAAMAATVVLLVVVSLTLAVASGGRWGQEARLLQALAPRHSTPDAYRTRVRVTEADVRFVTTPFGTHEVHLAGVVQNNGDRVLDRADLDIRLIHLFRDEQYAYTFSPVTPTVEGVDRPGPLLARSSRAFHYRVPDFPADVEQRDVRIRWGIGTVQFHEDLPIPTPLPKPAS